MRSIFFLLACIAHRESEGPAGILLLVHGQFGCVWRASADDCRRAHGPLISQTRRAKIYSPKSINTVVITIINICRSIPSDIRDQLCFLLSKRTTQQQQQQQRRRRLQQQL